MHSGGGMHLYLVDNEVYLHINSYSIMKENALWNYKRNEMQFVSNSALLRVSGTTKTSIDILIETAQLIPSCLVIYVVNRYAL